MTKLEKLLNIEIINEQEALKCGYNNELYESLTTLSTIKEMCKNREDIEIREYVNEDEFLLYNIHTTENTLYIEKYKDSMTEENMIEVMQETRCVDISAEIDILDFLYKSFCESNFVFE